MKHNFNEVIDGYSTWFLVLAGVSLVVSVLSVFALVVACARTRFRVGPSIIEWTKLMQYGWDTIGVPLSICLRQYPVVGELDALHAEYCVR